MVVNIGVDSADVERFARLLAQDRERLFSTLFGEEERAAMPALNGKREAGFVAGRWAAKEATLKALGTGIGSIALTEIGIFARESGQPYVTLFGRAVERSRELNIDRWHLSITHVKEIATAYVIAERIL
ncbi:MAG: holo-[acyl-carrier-protein] synthase [Chloroflexi bacterium]|nr:holo-[acyl-carrier-protein] synthase [Chloroflexota bacterium]